MLFDPSRRGLGMILKDYQEAALRYLWGLGGEGSGSRDVWMHVNKELGVGAISRTSVINFLEAMVDAGVLVTTETTFRGGHRRTYRVRLNEVGFKADIAGVVIRNLMRDFPEEMRKVLKDI